MMAGCLRDGIHRLAADHSHAGSHAGCAGRAIPPSTRSTAHSPGPAGFRPAATAPRAGVRRVSAPVSSLITAATPKHRIDADIQLAGAKPMVCPIDVHAEAHQGLMCLG